MANKYAFYETPEKCKDDILRMIPKQSKELSFSFKKFSSIEEAHKETGLSIYFLKKGIREGSIPHVKSGKKYLINMPLFIKQLDEMSIQGADISERSVSV